jgi:hypothetical protein
MVSYKPTGRDRRYILEERNDLSSSPDIQIFDV